jgi:hypothetical protein
MHDPLLPESGEMDETAHAPIIRLSATPFADRFHGLVPPPKWPLFVLRRKAA